MVVDSLNVKHFQRKQGGYKRETKLKTFNIKKINQSQIFNTTCNAYNTHICKKTKQNNQQQTL